MKNYKELAKKATQMSELMIGREGTTQEEIIKVYEGRVVILKVDKVSIRNSEYYICAFNKGEKKYFFGSGIALTRILDEIIADYDGSISDFNDDLNEGGGLAVHLFYRQSKETNFKYVMAEFE